MRREEAPRCRAMDRRDCSTCKHSEMADGDILVCAHPLPTHLVADAWLAFAESRPASCPSWAAAWNES